MHSRDVPESKSSENRIVRWPSGSLFSMSYRRGDFRLAFPVGRRCVFCHAFVERAVKNCHYADPRWACAWRPRRRVTGQLCLAPSGLTPRVLLVCVAMAVAPDLDILAGHHRTYTHSVGARRRSSGSRAGWRCGVACRTHRPQRRRYSLRTDRICCSTGWVRTRRARQV